jgi:hypothetical protein
MSLAEAPNLRPALVELYTPGEQHSLQRDPGGYGPNRCRYS